MKFEFAPYHATTCRMILTPESSAEGFQLEWLAGRLDKCGVEHVWEIARSLQHASPFQQVRVLHIFTTATLPPQPD